MRPRSRFWSPSPTTTSGTASGRFRDQRGHVAFQGLRFFLVALVAYGADLGILSALIAFGMNKVLAQAIAIVLVTPLNFLGNKLWSFRR
jgi:putative flippase GtrA